MNDPIFEKDGVKIFIDPEPINPRTEWDNLAKMVCFHKRYTLGDRHDYRVSDYNNWDELREAIVQKEDPVAIFELYMYDHSGLTVSMGPFDCPWDSGQIGFVLITMDTAKKELGAKRRCKSLFRKCREIIEGEVKTYDQYLRGEVYGYGHGEDSCWGFYGYEPEELAEMVLKGEA